MDTLLANNAALQLFGIASMVLVLMLAMLVSTLVALV